MIRIEDPDDPRVQHYRAVRDRDLAGREGRFIVEGEVVLRNLLSAASRFQTESILLSETRAAALEPTLAGLRPDLPVYVASQAVMDATVGFHIHRGVLAVGLRGENLGGRALLGRLPERCLVLGLMGLSNHDNIGGIFRNAAAFGVDAILLDRRSCDPLYRKALRVSVGASLLVPFGWSEDPGAMVGELEAAGISPFALSPSAPTTIDEQAWPERTALLLGAEGPGLPAWLLARVPALRIAMAPGFDSLNVATTSGIALHAVRRGRVGRPAD